MEEFDGRSFSSKVNDERGVGMVTNAKKMNGNLC